MCNTTISTKTSIFTNSDIEVSYSNISKYDKTYIKSALEQSKLSYCKKLQVGCIITKDNRIISNGYNGTLSNTDNTCEDIIEVNSKDNNNKDNQTEQLQTKISVFHAEENAILHMLRCGISTVDCVLYCSHSPCVNCAKMIVGAGIKTVYFVDYYKDINGIALLIQLGVKVIKVIEIDKQIVND